MVAGGATLKKASAYLRPRRWVSAWRAAEHHDREAADPVRDLLGEGEGHEAPMEVTPEVQGVDLELVEGGHEVVREVFDLPPARLRGRRAPAMTPQVRHEQLEVLLQRGAHPLVHAAVHRPAVQQQDPGAADAPRAPHEDAAGRDIQLNSGPGGSCSARRSSPSLGSVCPGDAAVKRISPGSAGRDSLDSDDSRLCPPGVDLRRLI